MGNIYEDSLVLHKTLRGKMRVQSKMDLKNNYDLSRAYSPGVAEPCREILKDPEKVYDYTIKGNSVAVVSDGSAVLGLGNIGAKAAIPVMEGKAILFKQFANIDAIPICLDTQDTDEIIETVKRISPIFGGINLEDIAAPKSFLVENALQDLGIPVFHDDQHGTAIVVLAGLINALKIVDKNPENLKIVINGAGAAGVAIARLLFDSRNALTMWDHEGFGDIIVCDSKGIISQDRDNLNSAKKELLEFTNLSGTTGTVRDALQDADVFIGVSVGDLLKKEDIQTMKKDAIIFALANPTPEIMPDEAYAGGAAIVGTGRSDLPNQINNVLAFPGIFRGALDARATSITFAMKLAAAEAIAKMVEYPSVKEIIPATLNSRVAYNVADAVKKAYSNNQIK